MDLQTLAAALAISDKRIAASSPSASSEPPDAPKENDLWVDTGVSPTMMRRWRGADVTTEREYQETHVGRGKNLLQIPPALAPATGASAVDVSDGGYTVSVTGSGAYAQAAIIYANVIPGREYTISAAGISGGNGPYVTVQKPDRTGIAQINATTLQAAFVPDDSRVIVIFVANGGNAALESPTTAVFDGVMIEAGDTATAYEPYQDVPFLALDNAQGQIESVAVEAGCRTRQAGTGTPSPDNVRALSGRESVGVRACGKNLLKPPGNATIGGVAYTLQSDGTYLANGTVASMGTLSLYEGVLPAGQYTISGGADGIQVALAVYDTNGTYIRTICTSSNGSAPTGTVTELTGDEAFHKAFIQAASSTVGQTVTDVVLSPQLEVGGTATAFEPYRSMGGGTVAPTEPLYGMPGAEDTVEVSVDGDVLVTRRTAIVEFDGTENWAAYNAGVSGEKRMRTLPETTPGIQPPPDNDTAANLLCSHYLSVPATTGGTYERVAGISVHASEKAVYIYDEQYSDGNVEAWKAYLAAQAAAGTPVTIVYELAAPTTETPADVDPIEPQAGQLNISTDADALSATVHGSGWDTISDQTGLLATIAQLTARVAALEQAAVNESTGG